MKLIMNRSEPRYEFDISDEIEELWAEYEIEQALSVLEQRTSDPDVVAAILASKYEASRREDETDPRLVDLRDLPDFDFSEYEGEAAQ